MSVESAVECSGCRRGYSSSTWRALPVVRTLTQSDVQPYVVGWEASRVIEVRACAECGRPMARCAKGTRAA